MRVAGCRQRPNTSIVILCNKACYALFLVMGQIKEGHCSAGPFPPPLCSLLHATLHAYHATPMHGCMHIILLTTAPY